MNRMSRRTILSTTPLIGGAMLFGSCGQAVTAPSAGEAEAQPEAKQPEAQPEPEVKDVIVWHHGFNNWDFGQAPVPKEIKGEFDATSGYTMISNPQPNGGFNDVATVVAAGTAPDVVKTQSWIQNEWALLEVTRWLDSYQKTSENVAPEKMWPDADKQTTYRGQRSALPYSIDTRLLFINAEHYLEAGLDPENPPATWDEMDSAVLKTFKAEGDKVARLSWDPYRGSGGSAQWMVPYWQQGGSIFSDDRLKFTVNNEKAVRALQWHMKQFAAQGGWPAIKAFHEGTNRNQQFGNGVMTHLYATNASRPTINTFEGLKWVYASYGLPSEGGELATYTGDWALCLPSGSENPDGGFAFLDFMYRPDIDLKWSIAMDRIPVQKATAQSADYTEGDPFKEFVIAQMEGAHFWLGVPGIAVIRREVNTMLNDLKDGKTTIPEALAQYEKAGQDSLDEWAERLGL